MKNLRLLTEAVYCCDSFGHMNIKTENGITYKP